MKVLCSEIYRKFLLRIRDDLTAQQKEDFRFYCRDELPQSVLEGTDFLDVFIHLEHGGRISYHDLQFLKGFLEVVRRKDLVRALEQYEIEMGLLTVLLSYLDSTTDTKFITFNSPTGTYTECVAMVVRCLIGRPDCSYIATKVQELAIEFKRDPFPLDRLVNLYASEIGIHTGSLTWVKVLSLVGFAADFLAARSRQTAEDTELQSFRDDIREVTNALSCRLSPWITDNGGLFQLCSFIKCTSHDDQLIRVTTLVKDIAQQDSFGIH